MTMLLGFLRGPLGRYVLILAGVGLLWVHGWHTGRGQVNRAWDAEKAAAKAARETKEAAGKAVAAEVAGKLAQTQADTAVRTRTLIQKVKVYVPAKDDAACVVPDGYVRLHDAAALGQPEVPAASSGSEQAPRVALSDSLSTVIGNYGQALTWRAEAQAWRDWYARQAEAWGR